MSNTLRGKVPLPKHRPFTEYNRILVDCQAWDRSEGDKQKRPRNARAQESETSGVKELLQKDRKLRGLKESIGDDFSGLAKSSDDATERLVGESASAVTTDSAPAGAQAVTARVQSIEAGQAEIPLQMREGPKTAGEAIASGIERLRERDPDAAVQLFQQALELPGKGAFRLKGSPREYSCASEGEEIAALYNLACAYSALDQKEAALESLAGAFDMGYQDLDGCRADPDLRLLHGQPLEGLIAERQKSQENRKLWNPLQRFWNKGKS